MPTFRRSLRSFWDLFRLEHGLMYGLGVVVGIYVSDPYFGDVFKILFGYLTAVFLQASAFALNDYSDYEVDVANNRLDRPLVRGELSVKTALWAGILMMPAGFVSAAVISPAAFAFAVAITVLGYIYNLKLKEFGLAGNIYIAFTMSAPFLFGSIVARNTITTTAVLLSAMAFLSGLGREIMKGIEDVEGDAIRDVKSVARVKGVRFAAILSALLYLLAVLISPLPPLLVQGFMDWKYILPVAVTDVILIYVAVSVVRRHGKETIDRYRKYTLVGMALGLIGFLGGAF